MKSFKAWKMHQTARYPSERLAEELEMLVFVWLKSDEQKLSSSGEQIRLWMIAQQMSGTLQKADARGR